MKTLRHSWRAGLLAAALLAADCRPQELSPELAVTGRGGELRVLLPAEPRGLDPNAPGDEIVQRIAPSLFSPLVGLDTDGRLLPVLAESWMEGAGGRSVTFRLRRGVRWHDGRPFGAGDVRWTFEHLKRTRSLAFEAFRRISRIETPDERTVVLHLEEPWAPLVSTLAWGGAYILPRPPPGRSGSAQHPVGTGPFRFVAWERGRSLKLAANRGYFLPGPLLDRVTFLFQPDPDRALQMLLRGAADLSLTRIEPDDLLRLGTNPEIRVVTAPSDARYLCALNLLHPALADRRVREAVNRAVDRAEIVDRALLGFGAPAFGFYTPTVPWAYNGDAHVPPFDRGRARALLAEAGLPAGPDGVRLRLELLTPEVAPLLEVAALLREQLREVGIALRVETLPVDRWLERVLERRDFEMTLMAGSQGPDPENLRFRFGSRSPHQFQGYGSPELDAALEEGAHVVDLPRRAAAYFRAQAILARDLPVVPLAEAVHASVFRRRVHGLPQAEARGLVAVNDYSLVRVRP